jgi:hypothetical protein
MCKLVAAHLNFILFSSIVDAKELQYIYYLSAVCYVKHNDVMIPLNQKSTTNNFADFFYIQKIM